MDKFTEQEYKMLRKLATEGITSRLNTGKNREEVKEIMHLKLKIVDQTPAPETDAVATTESGE